MDDGGVVVIAFAFAFVFAAGGTEMMIILDGGQSRCFLFLFFFSSFLFGGSRWLSDDRVFCRPCCRGCLFFSFFFVVIS